MVTLEIFHLNNLSGRSMALGLTQPLTEMSKKDNANPVTGPVWPRGFQEV